MGGGVGGVKGRRVTGAAGLGVLRVRAVVVAVPAVQAQVRGVVAVAEQDPASGVVQDDARGQVPGRGEVQEAEHGHQAEGRGDGGDGKVAPVHGAVWRLRSVFCSSSLLIARSTGAQQQPYHSGIRLCGRIRFFEKLLLF